jgi:ATP-binding cassette subfamily B protein
VLQEPFFFDGSVRDNLAFGLDRVSERQLQEALELACMDEDIGKLKGGLDAPMGLQGARFSRGQRQRLSLARALLGRPRILLLDEATSSLDLPTEAQLHDNLSRISCTRIIIAHRLHTVRDADRILVLDRGQIVSAGGFDALAARPGLFQQMVGNLG